MEETIVRTLSYYRKKGDTPSGEYPLTRVNSGELRALFGIPPDDPMYEVYPVGPGQVPFFQEALRQPLDLGQYDYFVECHAAPDESRGPADSDVSTARSGRNGG